MKVSPAQAREAARTVWRQTDLTTQLGVSLAYPDAAKEAVHIVIEAAKEVMPIENGKRSLTGISKDLVAPSVWHAACYLLYYDHSLRLCDADFEDDVAFDTAFGRRPVYRGQPRTWHMIPTAWRNPFPTSRTLQAMRAYLDWYMTDGDAIELELFGRIRNDDEPAGIAQHYEVPTNLLDFTFDPIVALFFALGRANAPFSGEDTPRDCAVIYITTVHTLLEAGNLALHFPPIQARRLYRQSGLFLDYGPPQSIPELFTFEPSWTLAEENCGRLFVPRSYPVAEEQADWVTESLLTPDDFFLQVADAAKHFAQSHHDVKDAPLFISGKVTARPPWRLKGTDLFVYTDDEFVAIGDVLQRYLTSAALIQAGDTTCLDPVVIGIIANRDPRILTAMLELSKMPGPYAGRYKQVIDAIDRSIERLNLKNQLSNFAKHNQHKSRTLR